MINPRIPAKRFGSEKTELTNNRVRNCCAVIFKVYDTDGNGKVTSSDMLQVLRDLSGSFLTDEQRQVRGLIPFLILSLR